MPVFDELGHRWQVGGGDPASRLVNALKRKRYDLIVLPLRTLATGEVTEPVELPEDVIRRVRLLDCLDVLKETAA